MIRTAILTLSLIGSLAACKPDAAPETVDWLGPDIIWQVQEIGGIAVPEGIEVTLSSPEPGLIAGSSGCNRYNGRIEVDGAIVKVGALAGTRMACAPEAMAVEQRFHSEIGRADRVARSGDALELSRQGVVILRATRQGA
jgi:putative lipoprotein